MATSAWRPLAVAHGGSLTLPLVSLVAFLVLGTLAVKRFRGQQPE